MVRKKKTTEQFVVEANIKHGVGRYDYSLVDYINTYTKVIIICSIHQKQFEQSPNVHLRGHGCPDCGRESAVSSRTKTTEQFIIEANIKHGVGKYDYSLVDYINGTTKVIIICPSHQKQFLMTPDIHLSGCGCPDCVGKNKTTGQCIIEFNNKHGKGRYDYSLVDYITAHTKVIIICPIHDKRFLMRPNDHLTGYGCPLCKESKGEKSIRKWLTESNIEFNTQHNPIQENPRLAFDFWLPDYRLLIEFDGRQHYEPITIFGGQSAFESQQVRDQQKTQWCIDNNIELLRIPYTEIKKIPLILSQKLINTEISSIIPILTTTKEEDL